MYHYLFLMVFSLFVQQDEFQAEVTSVEDGDTFEVIAANDKKYTIRLYGVDCPEDGQAFSAKAKLFTEAACRNKKVKIVKRTVDGIGRVVADVILPDGKSLAKELLKFGYAWHYKRFSNDADLDQLEQEAKKLKKGLWVEPDPMAPWDYKKQKKTTTPQ